MVARLPLFYSDWHEALPPFTLSTLTVNLLPSFTIHLTSTL